MLSLRVQVLPRRPLSAALYGQVDAREAQRAERLSACEGRPDRQREAWRELPDAFDFRLVGDGSQAVKSGCRIASTRRPADGVTRAVGMVMHESQQIAAEHRDLAAHAHRAGAEHHGKEDHPTGHESSRQALEHSNQAYLLTQQQHEKARTGSGTERGTHEAMEQDIAALAYVLWQARGCPGGSPEEDWFRAVEELRSRH